MQEVPIKLYRTPDRLTVAAPMPGLLPEDITIEVTANHHLVLHGALRGVPADVQVFRRLEPAHGRSRRKQPKVVEEQREMLVDEWTRSPRRPTVMASWWWRCHSRSAPYPRG
jgi:hypothetical protein